MEWGGESRLNFYCHPPMTFMDFLYFSASLSRRRGLSVSSSGGWSVHLLCADRLRLSNIAKDIPRFSSLSILDLTRRQMWR